MVVLAGILDSGARQMWCSAAMHISPLTGMVPMYALMSSFHFTPWPKLISGWRGGVRLALKSGGGACTESPHPPPAWAEEGSRSLFHSAL